MPLAASSSLRSSCASAVLAVEERAVGPLGVEAVAERLAHAPILKERTPQIEGVALHSVGSIVGNLVLLERAVAHRRDVVRGGPILRRRFQTQVVRAGLQRLERDGHVAVVVEAQRVEVVAPAVHRQILAPIVGDALVRAPAAGLELIDLVGCAAERRIERRVFEVALLPIVLGQHRQLAEDERQLAVLTWFEAELDGTVADLLYLVDAGVVGTEDRRSLRAQGVEGPHHVLDRDRLAVVPARLRAQGEDHPRTILRRLDALGEQAVLAERLVGRRRQQRIVDLRASDVGIALDDERIEAVEGAQTVTTQHPALRRVGVGVVEMGEVGPVLEIAVHGDAVDFVVLPARRSGKGEQ